MSHEAPGLCEELGHIAPEPAAVRAVHLDSGLGFRGQGSGVRIWEVGCKV